MPSLKEKTELEKYQDMILDRMKRRLKELKGMFCDSKKENDYERMGNCILQINTIVYLTGEFDLVTFAEMEMHLLEVEKL